MLLSSNTSEIWEECDGCSVILLTVKCRSQVEACRLCLRFNLPAEVGLFEMGSLVICLYYIESGISFG